MYIYFGDKARRGLRSKWGTNRGGDMSVLASYPIPENFEKKNSNALPSLQTYLQITDPFGTGIRSNTDGLNEMTIPNPKSSCQSFSLPPTFVSSSYATTINTHHHPPLCNPKFIPLPLSSCSFNQSQHCNPQIQRFALSWFPLKEALFSLNLLLWSIFLEFDHS